MIEGVGVSAGLVEGTVRVVTDSAFADVEPDEFLIATTPDPDWSSIRVPCVVNTRYRTRVVRTGDRSELMDEPLRFSDKRRDVVQVKPNGVNETMGVLGVSMPGLNRKGSEFPEFAKLAEEAGFATVWDYEFWRNPLMIHMDCAAVTSRIELGTGIMTAFSRSPFEMANAAADLDERSGGRLVLGIGPGAFDFLEGFHNTDGKNVRARMSEYIDVVRLSWDYLQDFDPSHVFEGEHYRFVPPPFNPWGVRRMDRTRIPILVAGLRPKMIELAGEKCDGWIGFMCPPAFIEEKVKPQIAAGAEKAGRDPSEVRLVSETICSVHEDRSVAMERARVQAGMYSCHPLTAPMIEHHGLQEDRDALLQAVMTQGPQATRTVTSDAIVEALSITGTPDEAREKLAAYDAGLDQVILHTPYVPPLGPEESADAYRNIITAFGDIARERLGAQVG